MVSDSTRLRAEQIVKDKEIYMCHDSYSGIMHFQVKQRNRRIADVYRKEMHGVVSWSCGAVSSSTSSGKVRFEVDSRGRSVIKKFGCVMSKKNGESEPFCSHSYAAKLFMEKKLEGGINE